MPVDALTARANPVLGTSCMDGCLQSTKTTCVRCTPGKAKTKILTHQTIALIVRPIAAVVSGQRRGHLDVQGLLHICLQTQISSTNNDKRPRAEAQA